jgi:CheY-like chemotaxis protein
MELSSAPGGGLQVRIEVPEGMVSIPVVLVRTPSHALALSIRGVDRIVPADGAVRDDAGALRFVDEDGVLPAVRLDEVIGLPGGFFAREAEAARLSGSRRATTARQAAGGEVALLVRRAGAGMVAVIAPSPGQTRSVVVRPLPPWLPAIAAVEGATVLGDGAVATVLDLPALVSLESPLAATRLPEGPAQRLPLCLVVDDSVSVRRSMELFLQDLGVEVESAGDGMDALALAQRRVPALAIVDLEMPRMNGVELCRALRDDPRTRSVPVIMITSRSSERHRALALEAGVDVFLTKPYSEDELAAEIRRCLVGRPAVG